VKGLRSSGFGSPWLGSISYSASSFGCYQDHDLAKWFSAALPQLAVSSAQSLGLLLLFVLLFGSSPAHQPFHCSDALSAALDTSEFCASCWPNPGEFVLKLLFQILLSLAIAACVLAWF
jgi:hypothetical protein